MLPYSEWAQFLKTRLTKTEQTWKLFRLFVGSAKNIPVVSQKAQMQPYILISDKTFASASGSCFEGVFRTIQNQNEKRLIEFSFFFPSS